MCGGSNPSLLKKKNLGAMVQMDDVICMVGSPKDFEAKNPIGKPADVEGRVIDEVLGVEDYIFR